MADINLQDGMYQNAEGFKLPCIRCNRSISKGAAFHVHHRMVVGLECLKHVKALEEDGVQPAELAVAAKEQYRAYMREATLKGMERKGLLKPKAEKPALKALSAVEAELLTS
jgi:hypothetical protein